MSESEKKAIWDVIYSSDKKIWGEKPSELAVYAHNFIKQNRQLSSNPDLFILDLGCGYGRDSIFLAQNIQCHILGVDNSATAIEMARAALPEKQKKRIEFLCYGFEGIKDKYDVILCSNVYQILKPEKRAALRNTVKRCLKSESMVFLSTLSENDPQHSGKGIPVENDPNSFLDEKYLHLSSREELEKDFEFLNLSALFERGYLERRTTKDHHHISWILMGKPI